MIPIMAVDFQNAVRSFLSIVLLLVSVVSGCF